MGQHRNWAGQNMPPEFSFQPTRMFFSEPPRNIVFEDAMGSQGTAFVDPRTARLMDPIHWRTGRSPADNAKETANGTVVRMTQMLKTSVMNRTHIRKFDRPTVTTYVEEPQGARKPRIDGRSPQEIARGAKPPKRVEQKPSTSMVQDIVARRGLRAGARAGYAQYLMNARPETVEAIHKRLARNDEKRTEPMVEVGSGQYTEEQVTRLPAGYVRALTERAAAREAKQPKPQVMFDPRESKGLSTHGQYSTIPRPGLVKVAENKYVRPEQVGLAPQPTIGRLGNNAQPETKGGIGLLIGVGVLGLLGVSLLMGA